MLPLISGRRFLKRLPALRDVFALWRSILNKMKVVKGLSVSLVGRNLWTILKHTDNIDPESAYNNTNGQGLELNGYPATRNVGFNVNVKF